MHTLIIFYDVYSRLTLFYMTPINPLFMYILFFLHKPPILHTVLYHAGPIATHPPHQAALLTAQYYTYYLYKQHNIICINKPILCTLHMYDQPVMLVNATCNIFLFTSSFSEYLLNKICYSIYRCVDRVIGAVSYESKNSSCS